MQSIIECTNLKKIYQNGETENKVLNNINLIVEQGDFISIMGTSGVGKSTLINILGLIDSDFEGAYRFNHAVVKEMNDDELSEYRNNYIGFIFQNFNLIDEYNVKENILLPFLYTSRKSSANKINELAKKMNIFDKLSEYPPNLSGGQKQRVAIMRALINQPQVIIADEPTGSLDEETRDEILDILVQLNKEGKTIILVTHDPKVANKSSKILEIKEGQLMEKLG
ncbi:ABC transporter ATP-binding protein [Staphylococcus felis]|uniref:Putative hemin import ATP-binding protein HrtA n=1 Tax=Staphylococcus felis TaxID=46127 RepID=A0A3E0IR74_9STAP|nr:ABC transporter ATP-binding protein [Staphylococcus felis]REH98298.1 ABC transporter ATP-binding protein [Staphylococcus felis]